MANSIKRSSQSATSQDEQYKNNYKNTNRTKAIIAGVLITYLVSMMIIAAILAYQGESIDKAPLYALFFLIFSAFSVS